MALGYSWRFYPEEDCVSIESAGFKKEVFAVLRPTGFMRDLDKKGAKGRMFQLSVSVPDEEGNRTADVIVPVDSLAKEDQAFVKKFLESDFDWRVGVLVMMRYFTAPWSPCRKIGPGSASREFSAPPVIPGIS